MQQPTNNSIEPLLKMNNKDIVKEIVKEIDVDTGKNILYIDYNYYNGIITCER